jgi:hypothetical protein
MVARSLVTALVVGTIVSGGHWLAPSEGWWVPVHAALPGLVFSWGAWSAGVRSITSSLAARGLVTVAVVAVAFTAVNDVTVHGLQRITRPQAQAREPVSVGPERRRWQSGTQGVHVAAFEASGRRS